jgi:hypothetical protein
VPGEQDAARELFRSVGAGGASADRMPTETSTGIAAPRGGTDHDIDRVTAGDRRRVARES